MISERKRTLAVILGLPFAAMVAAGAYMDLSSGFAEKRLCDEFKHAEQWRGPVEGENYTARDGAVHNVRALRKRCGMAPAPAGAAGV